MFFFLKYDISIRNRRTTIEYLWPFYDWLTDCLALCASRGHKIQVVFLTHLFVGVDSPVRVSTGEMEPRTDLSAHSHSCSSANTSKPAHTCAKKEKRNLYLTCSFAAPKDWSGTAVTWEVMTLRGVRLSRLWESPMQGHRSLPAALAVWKVMGQSLTTMRLPGRVSKARLGQWGAQIYRYWVLPQSSAKGNYTEYEHARWGLAAIFHFYPEPL